ncbi:hypothetical protein BN3456_01584 [Clostridium sp. C105KSO13]|nr:hypothetical protein BN3456_01584 [Clostridium sp. C105KSO13]
MRKKLLLSKELYNYTDVQETIQAYSSLASIELSSNQQYLICDFHSCLYDLVKTISEFENYLIGVSNLSIPASVSLLSGVRKPPIRF